jgi:hypothetical protein
LDADTMLEENFLERVTAKLLLQSSIGIASGICAGEPWISSHPRGNNRVYRRECWEQIVFPVNGLGWDTVDEVFARLNGWQTLAFSDIVCKHTRSKLPDYAYRLHQGKLSRYLGYYWWFVLGRSGKMMFTYGAKPSLAYFVGYLKGGLGTTDKRITDAIKTDQIRRITHALKLK